MIDKSTLQSLSPREADWMQHHFRLVIPPVLFAEVIGDIAESSKTTTDSGEGDAKSLANKIQGHSVHLNVPSDEVIRMEMMGRKWELDGRPAVFADRIKASDGTVGALVDQTPMQQVLDRWRAGDFIEMERTFSRNWRDHLASVDLQSLMRQMKGLRNKELRKPEDVTDVVEKALFPENANHFSLNLWMSILGVPLEKRRSVLKRWKLAGRPAAVEFLPYAAHCVRLLVYFQLGVGMAVIPTRSSNTIDFMYFEYLPFAQVFCSGDKLHDEFFDQFSKPFNAFVSAKELKSALREIADHWDGISEDVKNTGSYNYAAFPPIDQSNAITWLYDSYIPDWRERAATPEPEMDSAAEAKLMEHLRPIMEAIDRQKSG